MKFVTDKIKVLDNTEWQSELFNDRGHQNGNKLRMKRLYKTNNYDETYVLQIIPTSVCKVRILKYHFYCICHKCLM